VAYEAGLIEKRPRSLAHVFLERADTTPAADAYYYPVDAGWQESTWGHTRELVEGLAAGLIELGLRPEERVAIVCTTRYEWVLAFLATLVTGAAVTSVEPTASDDELAYVLRDSGARVVVAEDYDTVRALWRIRDRIRDVVKVVQIDGDYPDERVLTLDGLLALGHVHLTEHPRAVPQRLYAVRRDGLAVLLYPRDRPWPPAGVVVNHSALTYQGAAVASLEVVDDRDLLHACLPLTQASGIALLAAQLVCGFPLSLEGRPDHAVDSLAVVRPTFLAASPDLLGEIRERLQETERSGMLRRRTMDRALDAAREVREHRDAGQPIPRRLARRHRKLDSQLLSPVREVFGGRLRFLLTCAGEVEAGLTEFFELAGVRVLQTFGLAETGGVVTVQRPDDPVDGSAGRPLPGSEVTVDEDGEVLVHGPGVGPGYHRRTKSVPTTLNQDWLRTGERGSVDAVGRLWLDGGRRIPHGRR
jgi:long-chain acyl-CoA synthetase